MSFQEIVPTSACWARRVLDTQARVHSSSWCGAKRLVGVGNMRGHQRYKPPRQLQRPKMNYGYQTGYPPGGDRELRAAS